MRFYISLLLVTLFMFSCATEKKQLTGPSNNDDMSSINDSILLDSLYRDSVRQDSINKHTSIVDDSLHDSPSDSLNKDSSNVIDTLIKVIDTFQ